MKRGGCNAPVSNQLAVCHLLLFKWQFSRGITWFPLHFLAPFIPEEYPWGQVTQTSYGLDALPATQLTASEKI